VKIVIIGAGAVGSDLARNLSATKHDVVLVDRRADVLAKVQENLDCRFVAGNGTSPAELERIGMKGCGLFAAVTNRDEINVVAALTAKQLGARITVARVRSEDYYVGGRTVFPGIDMTINPDHEAAHRIREILFQAGAVEAYRFANGRVRVVAATVEPDSAVAGKTLRELRRQPEVNLALVAAVVRDGATLIPNGDTELEPDDTIYFTGTRRLVDRSLYHVHAHLEPLHKVMIVGATAMGIELARDLHQSGVKVKLVDGDDERCRGASEQLPNVLVLNIDPVDTVPLVDEGIGEMDGFVAVGADEEVNMLSCLLARRQGARRTVCLVNRVDYLELLPRLGIDSAVSPRRSTATAIARFVKRGAVVSAEALGRTGAEILQYRVASGHRAAGVPLKDLDFPADAVIGAVVKPRGIEMPGGKTILEPGDEVLVFALPSGQEAVETFFSDEAAPS
jgi:trk system potassium uptake protein TrkA